MRQKDIKNQSLICISFESTFTRIEKSLVKSNFKNTLNFTCYRKVSKNLKKGLKIFRN
jgi:hypothetical protein